MVGALALGGVAWAVVGSRAPFGLGNGLGSRAAGTGTAGSTAAPTTTSPATAAPGSVAALTAENAKSGTRAWKQPAAGAAGDDALAGFLSAPSARPGDALDLFVQSRLGSWTATAYRIGWYAGTGGRQVWASTPQPAVTQPAAQIRAGGEVYAPWHRSFTLDTATWPEGTYLVVLRAGGRWKDIPLTLRSDSTRGRLVMISATTTYAAYNAWGGYSLYKAPAGSGLGRASTVSFHRPQDGNGASRYLSFEVTAQQRAERLHVPLAWLTSRDLETPGILDGALGVVSLGHDEYWSVGMRAALVKARDAGTNVAFLGGNAIYWRIRFGAEGQSVISYKDAGVDPVRDSARTTTLWRRNPHPQPENTLVGMLYECFPAAGSLVVRDPGFFLFQGTGATAGTRYPGLEGPETDRAYPTAGTPATLQVVAHSPITCGPTKRTYADMTYYTAPSGAGVFATGTMNWVPALRGASARLGIDAAAAGFARTVTDNLLRAMAAGPMGSAHPAVPDLAGIHANPSTSTGTGGQLNDPS